MDHYLAICEMEYNGLYIDTDVADKEENTLRDELVELNSEILRVVASVWPSEIEFNPSSLDHISVVLFGGNINCRVEEDVLNEDGLTVIYKTGKRKGEVKTRLATAQKEVCGLVKSTRGLVKNKKGLFKTNTSILSELNHPLASLILKYRGVKKLITTYYYTEKLNKNNETISTKGMLSLIHNNTGCVHSEFKTAYTSTGRLSSSSPNVQNIPKTVMNMFTSRFGADGVLIEFDYSQLEVRVQAQLAQSPNFIRDILDGVDFHCKRLSYVENISYEETVRKCDTSSEWKEKRRKAKIISFQKAYGASPQRIAREAELPLEKVETVFALEDEEYPEINKFYAKVLDEVQKSRYTVSKLMNFIDKRTGEVVTREGENESYGKYKSPTGKMYTFKQYGVITRSDRPFRYFKMPDILDYPVQGMAADIVADRVGTVYRTLLPIRDKCKLVNEVHDSLIIDVKKAEAKDVIKMVVNILQNLETDFKNKFNIKWNVPLTVDYAVGNSWAETK